MVSDKEIEEGFENWCKRLNSSASFIKDATEGYPRFSGFKAGAKWMQEKMKEDIRTLTYMVDEAQTHPVTSGNNYPELVKQADAILAKYESDDK